MPSPTNTRQVLSNLTAAFPVIKPFLNINKFATSNLFSDVLRSATEHAIACGDRGFIDRALSLLYGTPHYQNAVKWVCERAGFSASTKNNQLVFEKTALQNDKLVPFVDFVANKRTLGDSQLLKAGYAGNSPPSPPKPKKKKPKKIDILDSWARLEGCYGAGKRR